MIEEQDIFAIVGPTASGKTELGVALAKRLETGEVINCDSVQIYKDIQVATAKPDEAEMQGVPHHLISYVNPERNYTAADWCDDAANTIVEIEKKGGRPILVGGTGFYLRSLRNPLFESPKTDEALRNRLNRIRELKGAEYLYRMLERVDPEAATKQYPKDYPRVQRALEVCFQTGTKFSELQPKRIDPPEFAKRIRIFALRPPREELYKIINRRAEKHFESGLVEEVIELRKQGLPDRSSALGSHGYRRVCEYLRGERTLESAIEKTRQDVRNYAKRQMSWFRGESDITWLDGFGNEESVQNELFKAI
jgi:tRNA dimethylallyltransferase